MPKKPDWRRYLLVAALFAAGLMAKPMVITLPFVLLLLDYWPLERITLDGIPNAPGVSNGVPQFSLSLLLLEKVPLLFLSAASAWITLKAQGTSVRSIEEFPLAYSNRKCNRILRVISVENVVASPSWVLPSSRH